MEWAEQHGGGTDLAQWAQGWGTERQWGIEGAWNYGRGLAQYLVAAGEVVCEVNTRWTAQERGRARNRSKSDARDAQAVALYVWREGATLPRVTADDATAVFAVLVAQRETAVAEATRLCNQAHQLLLQLDPTYRTQLPALTTADGLAALERYQPGGTGALEAARVAAVRMVGQRLRLAAEHADQLEGQIEAHARVHGAPLIRLRGSRP